MKPKKECAECRRVFKTKSLHKYKGRLLCLCCKKREEKKNGKVIPNCNPSKVPKYLLPKKEKKLKEKIPKKERIIKRRIKYTKRVSSYGMALTLDEKQFLLRKYMKNGCTFNEAIAKVDKDKAYLKELVKKLREESKSEKDINKRFKEEFAKLRGFK